MYSDSNNSSVDSHQKIPFHRIGIPTNRNQLGSKFQFGISLAPNHNARVKQLLLKNGVVKRITLPSILYHTTFTPIHEKCLNPKRIFYASYDRFQSIAHGIDRLQDRLQDRHPQESMYVYELEPKIPAMSVVLFDKKARPKNMANKLNIRFNRLNNKYAFSYGLTGMSPKDPTIMLESNRSFKEGSGDNMILGHLLCATGDINGIRNTQNQNEIAVCDPSKFFRIKAVNKYPVQMLRHAYQNQWNKLYFNKKRLPYGYKFKNNNKSKEKELLKYFNDLRYFNHRIRFIPFSGRNKKLFFNKM